LKPTGYVNDYENIFTPEQRADLEKICSDYEKKTSIEICLVTSADFNLDYDVDLANKWSVGKDGLDNGLMIILSKAQRDCSVRTGYGLEPFLPDAKLKHFTDSIYPRTLSKDMFYEGMKELILACQNYMGDQAYDFKVRYKQIQDNYDAGMRKVYLFRFLYILFGLIVLGGIGILIYLNYKKQKEYQNLKNEILLLIKNLRDLRDSLINGKLLTKELENEFEALSHKISHFAGDKNLKRKMVNEQTKALVQNVYNKFLDYKQTINTVNSMIKSIDQSKSDIEKYLQDNYSYCEKYLKNELNNIIPDTQIDNLRNGEYTRSRMNKLVGIQTSLEGKLKIFLNKSVQIKKIIDDNQKIENTIQDLNKSYEEYVRNKTILHSAKIGKKYTSLVNLEYNDYISKMKVDMSAGFNELQKGNYESAVNSYGNYITTLTLITGAFSAVTILFNKFNKSNDYIRNNQNQIKTLSTDIESHINKAGVSYSRKSSYEDIKTKISKFNSLISTDIIDASNLLKTIIDELTEVLSRIKSDISSHQRQLAASAAAAASRASYSSSSSRSSGGFGGFSGGSFGGGGVRRGF
jgi:uncharacterized membrane protein YgcG